VHPRQLPILLFVVVATLGISVEAKQCKPSGLFFRSHGDQLKIESVDSAANPNAASFQLIVLGHMVQEAPIQAKSEGKMALTEDHCLGVYSEGNYCTLVFDFLPKSATIRQIGTCLSGAGVNADGTFVRTTKPERYLP
jgi:hypothetical protein